MSTEQFCNNVLAGEHLVDSKDCCARNWLKEKSGMHR